MDVNAQPKLRFVGVDFPKVKVDSFKVFDDSIEEEIHVGVYPKYFLPKDEKNCFHIVMFVEVSVDKYFEITLTAIGTFELSIKEDDPKGEDIRHQFININAPAIMFPYVRSFITTLSSALGNVTSTLTIPPRLFSGKLEEISSDESEEINSND